MSEHRNDRSIASILTLDQLDELTFRSTLTTERATRTFGGEVAGQAVMAAGRTVSQDRVIHSAHCHFLRPGDSSEPVTYQVVGVRDGGSYSTRRVEAIQHGRLIFHLTASFHVGDVTDMDHQAGSLRVASPHETPLPEVAFADDEEMLAWITALAEDLLVDMRFPESPTRALVRMGRPTPARQSLWLRATGTLGDDPLTHAAALTYCSDLLLLSTGLGPHARNFTDGDLQFATLDHTLWFHDATRADHWFLHDMEGLWTGRGRSLSRGSIFEQGGRLVASTIQEGVIRPGVR
ncbi:putative acyl-CoA thioesterase [Janibacter sp. HTCC2649]|uniref:acyl-CoA thioesterase n=1 Tax=Janibacter sp. HTCC2649 TaxID=313589 RepID=UPI0000670CFE|nr:acyl-CoA thioesterase domain-containing protein [Janibacter sp. HTCC2649]EAQ00625.1 putative acyl-CoA thioesterase [Janibacter sp. HTCC2649]